MSDYQVPQPVTSNLLSDQRYDLSERQLAMLAKSGIRPETAKAHQWRRIPEGLGGLEALQPILNLRWRAEYGECLYIPQFDEDGKQNQCQVRPEWPRGRCEDDPKYVTPRGASLLPYFTSGVLRGLLDRTVAEVVITEGAKKALAMWQEGFLAIGLSGVGGWHKPKSKFVLHRDLQRIDWKGVHVHVVFDSDAADNEQIALQEKRFASALRKAGAKVEIRRIAADESDFDGAKIGVDDVLARDGSAGLRKLLMDAANILQEEQPKIGSVERLEYARTYQQHVEQDGRRLAYWQHDFYRYRPDALSWGVVDKEDMAQEALIVLQQYYSDVGDTHATETLRQTKAHRGFGQGIRSDSMPPIWLREDRPGGFENPHDMLVTRSQIVNPQSGETLPRTADLFCPTYVDVNYDATAPEPEQWLKLLGQTLKHDYQIRIFQEFFGWCLLPLPASATRRSTQKIVYLIGPPGCGKGVIVRVLSTLLGEQHVAATTLAALDRPFGAHQLVGKSLCTIQEVKSAGPNALGLLKSISGEDMVTVERKNVDPYSIRLPVKLLIVNNELVRFYDSSSSLERRLIPLQAYKGFDDKDTVDGLSERIIEAEAPGILNWSLEGWRRLSEKGFTELPEDAPGRELRELQRHLDSPISAFLDECCELGVACSVPVRTLFNAWKVWCEVNDHKAGSPQSFGAKIQPQGFKIEKPRVHLAGEGTTRERVYVGVKLKKHVSDIVQSVGARFVNSKYGA